MLPFAKYREELNEQISIPSIILATTENQNTSLRCGDDIIRSLVQYQVQLRSLHWATESFAQHKASDETYGAINDIIDTLVECYQGYCGRIRIGGQFTIFNYDTLNIDNMNSSAINDLNELKCVASNYSDICNIIDEFISIISKFKYLLTLR